MTRELACERCGRRFGCGVDDAACWCAELKLEGPPPIGFGDCLCPDCLVQASPEAAGALDVRTQRPDPAGELGV